METNSSRLEVCPADEIDQNYYYLVWSSIEPCIGCVGCCLPTLRPLFTAQRDVGIFSYVRSLFGTRSTLRVESREDITFSRPSGQQTLRPSQSKSTLAKVSSDEAFEFANLPVRPVNGQWPKHQDEPSEEKNEQSIHSVV